MPNPLKVGSVPYLVGRPLNFGLEHEPTIELSFDVPARLATALLAEDLDVALVSSIHLARQASSTYLPGLGVIGTGRVSSVQLFLHKPLGEVRTIALDPVSRTSQALLQILAREDPDFPRPVSFHEFPLGTDPRTAHLPGTGAPADAFLRIGDPALAERFREDMPHYNLSEAWARLTGLPFVFAAWIARPGIDLEDHRATFERAAFQGTKAAPQLAREAAKNWNLDPLDIQHYLTQECSFQIDPVLQARALAAFRAKDQQPASLE